MGSSNYVHVNVDKVLRETEKAFLVLVDGEEVWLPHSQIADWDDYEAGDENVTMSVTEWIAEQKGLL
jgi:hypothetical protein